MTQRDKQIMCGLFLSKFDQQALEYLGFSGFTEAFNALGYGLGARPASIKNYRDEFDPHYPNARQGWHKRPFRFHCKKAYEAYGGLSIDNLGEMVKAFLLPCVGIETLPEVSGLVESEGADMPSPFAKRLITGRAAEKYFVSVYQGIPEFADTELVDTSLWGCGFDFKLSPIAGVPYKAVEVKGLRTRNGQILMTDLEHRVSQVLRDRYFLFIVRNFEDKPYHTVVQDPLNSSLRFEEIVRTEVRLTWTATLS